MLDTWLQSLSTPDAKAVRAWVAHTYERTEFEVLDHSTLAVEQRPTLARVFHDLPASFEPSNPSDVAAFLCAELEHLVDPDDPQRPANRAVLVGGPGQGKSTVLRYVAQVHRAALLESDRYPRPSAPVRLPVFVEARRLAAWLGRGGEGGVAGHLAERVPVQVAELDRWLRVTPLLVLLDGLDEVVDPAARARVVEALFDLIGALPHVPALVSTRPSGRSTQLTPWAVLRLRPLELDEAKALASHVLALQWQGRPQLDTLSERLAEELGRPAVRALSTSPLQVAMVVALLGRAGTVPAERWRLLDAFYSMVLDREIDRDTALSRFLRDHGDDVRDLHRRAALVLHVRAEVSGHEGARLHWSELGALLRRHLEDEGYDTLGRHRLAGTLMKAATERLVLLVERDLDGGLAFEVRLLQEAFAAEALCDGPDALIPARLAAVVHSGAWSEVVVLAIERLVAGQRRHLVDAAIAVLEAADVTEEGERARPGGRLAIRLLDGLLAKKPAYRERLVRLARSAFGLPDIPALPAPLWPVAREALQQERWWEVVGAWRSADRFASIEEQWAWAPADADERGELDGRTLKWSRSDTVGRGVSVLPWRWTHAPYDWPIPVARGQSTGILWQTDGVRLAADDDWVDMPSGLAAFRSLVDRYGNEDCLDWRVRGALRMPADARESLYAGKFGDPQAWDHFFHSVQTSEPTWQDLLDWSHCDGPERLAFWGMHALWPGGAAGVLAQHAVGHAVDHPGVPIRWPGGSCSPAEIIDRSTVPAESLRYVPRLDDNTKAALVRANLDGRVRVGHVIGIDLPATSEFEPFWSAVCVTWYLRVRYYPSEDWRHPPDLPPAFRVPLRPLQPDATDAHWVAAVQHGLHHRELDFARACALAAPTPDAAVLLLPHVPPADRLDLLAHLVHLADNRPTGLHHLPTWQSLGLPALPAASDTLSERLGMPTPPHLRTLGVRDLRGIRALDLTLPERPPDDGQWVVILGENGTGKTTLLRGIALAAMGALRSTTAIGQADTPYVRLGRPQATVELTLADPAHWSIVVRDGEAPELPHPPPPDLFLAAYGVSRGSARGGPERGVNLDNPWEGVGTLFGDRSVPLIHAETWLGRFRAAGGWRERAWPALHAALCALLPDVQAIELTADGVRVVPTAGEPVPLAALSDGYLTTVGWTLDLVARWIHHCERQRVPIEPDLFRQMAGLVLVDELDLHLHPSWQQRVIDSVRRTFPRLSFVVTTHNPLTLHGTRPGELFVLHRVEGELQLTQIDIPPGTDADALLRGPWFGVDSTLDPDTAALLRAHQADALRGQADPERQRELARRLGPVDAAETPPESAVMRARLAALAAGEE